MRAMKDSRIEWIGSVPKEWNITVLKRLGSPATGSTPAKDNPDYWNGEIPWVSSKDMKSDYLLDSEDHITQKAIGECGLTLYNPGTLIFCVRSGILRHTFPVAVSTRPVTINQDLRALCLSDDVNPSFLLYYMRGMNDIIVMLYQKIGATVESIEMDWFLYFPVILPPLGEQNIIVKALNSKCAEIDALIAAKEKTNALLKERRQSIIYEAVTKGLDPTAPMKDSGVEWIGEIPETWSTRKTKYIGTFKSGDGITSENISDDDKYPVYGGNGIRGYTDRFTHEGSYILIGRQGALCGNVHLVRGSFWASEHAVVGDIVPDYEIRLAFYILTAFNLNRLSVTAAQPGLSVDQIINVIVPMPGSAEEQKEICDYLDSNCTEADSVIELNERTIRQLREYRQSLIYEVVTGKIEV